MRGTARFLIIGNGRTGSSWLQTSLNRLPDVNARRELKLDDGTFAVRPDVHLVIGDGASVQHAIDVAADDPSTPAGIFGSKLILNPYMFHGPAAFAALDRALEPDVRLILLKRSYLAVWLSWNARGVRHEVNEAVPVIGNDPMIREMKRLAKPEARHVVLYRGGEPLDGYAGEAIHQPLAHAADGLLQLYANDMQALALCRGRKAFVLDYAEVQDRLTDVARFIGSRARAAEVAAIAREPQTVKLPSLEAYLHPIAPLHALSVSLDTAFAEAAAGADLAERFRWKDAATIVIRAPAVAAAFAAAGLMDAGPELSWSAQRPVYDGKPGSRRCGSP